MVVFPPCKINIGLQVISRQTDGYHQIATCFYPLPWCDALEILPHENLTFKQTGMEIPGSADDNLCLKAYGMLKKDFNLPDVQIHLHKIIPTGAGLGGGSSDAAWSLRLLNDIFKLSLSEEKLKQYATQLGSDCAFFIQDKPALGGGRGDRLEPIQIDLKGYFLRLITPDIHVSTAEAYAEVVPSKPETDLQAILKKPVRDWKDELLNDFEKSVFKKYPAPEGLKKQLYAAGALYASMSGSGSAVYGIFRDKNLKRELTIRESWSGWL